MTFQRLRAAVSCTLRSAFAGSLILLHPALCAAAPTGPFVAGLPDGGGVVPGARFFPRLVGAIVSMQMYFNQHMTAALRAMRHDGTAVWTLLALSFIYSIVHAAGPGHGKAVVSSYLLATRQTLRNGIALAFIASLAQAAGAIVLILVATLVLHMTSVSITWATFQFEIASDGVIVLLGCWLVWSKIIRPARSLPLGFTPVNALTRPDRYLADGAANASRFKQPMPAQGRLTDARCRSGRTYAHPSARTRPWPRMWRRPPANLRLRPCAHARCLRGARVTRLA